MAFWNLYLVACGIAPSRIISPAPRRRAWARAGSAGRLSWPWCTDPFSSP